MVPDFEAMEAGILRFVGRKHDPAVGVNGGWVPSEEPVTVPLRAEYVQEVQAGSLAPADEETARLCGVSFKASTEAKKPRSKPE
ncbi:hypothetical protein BE20_24910 [Sorangium cellulosum]|uniref:Uncharacterized protein n=1 Tax=Sorangium cellulosum TaxID=56 RepID=A0A150S5P8_SORCE|nr:hypothetical protein BE20_24910 [Sorangium cellulosum]KYF89277.1 hypothetical protein BE18_22860 [Sorangium cellulosum]